MLLCPLGTACRVRMAYDRYMNGGMETNLLDFTLCNFETILYLLKRIDKPFTSDEFSEIFYNGNPLALGAHRTASHNHVFWHLPHEFPADQSFQQFMPLFIERCNRRRERLKNLINTKDKCVHFVIFLCTNNGSPLEIPSVEKINELFAIVRNICSYSYMHFHILIHPDYNSQQYKTRIDALEINTYFHIHYIFYLKYKYIF